MDDELCLETCRLLAYDEEREWARTLPSGQGVANSAKPGWPYSAPEYESALATHLAAWPDVQDACRLAYDTVPWPELSGDQGTP